MSLGYDTQAKIENAVSKEKKQLSVSFNALVNANALDISEKLVRGFFECFEHVHESGQKVRALKLKVLIKGFAIGENLGGKMSEKLYTIRDTFEKKTGLTLQGFDVMYQQVDSKKNELPNWTFNFSFYDVDPTDPITGTAAWELYR